MSSDRRPADVADVEHLKMIQAIVARLAGNSFLVKGWSVTLVAGLTAVAKVDGDRTFAWIAVLVVVVFSGLDAYYLALERRFRALYDRAVRGEVADYTLTPPAGSWSDVIRAAARPSVWVLYVVLTAGAVLVAVGGPAPAA